MNRPLALTALFEMLKRRLSWVFVVLGVGVAGAVAVQMLQPPLVDATVVQLKPLVRTIQFSARVATLSRVDVGSTVTGRVSRVSVREGVRVRAGDVLLQLESAELDAGLAQAQAVEAQAKARIEGLRTTGRLQTASGLAQAEANLKSARAEWARAQQLVAQGFVSSSRLDEAQRLLALAEAQYASAQAQAQANTEVGTDTLQAEAQLQAARAASIVARARLEQLLIRAPASAQVLTRSVEPGQIVQPGRSLMSLALVGPTQLKAQVDERFLAQLAVGQIASVVADAFADQRLEARVASIAPWVDAQRGAIEVTLELTQSPPAFLREDMTLSVEVETARRAQTLVLPLAALRSATQTDSAQMWVLQDGHIATRDVRVGLRTLEAIEVTNGLVEGDVVVLSSTVPVGQRARAQWGAASKRASTEAKDKNAGAAGAALSNAMGR